MIPTTHEEVGIEEFGDYASGMTVLLNDGVPKDSDRRRSTTANDYLVAGTETVAVAVRAASWSRADIAAASVGANGDATMMVEQLVDTAVDAMSHNDVPPRPQR